MKWYWKTAMLAYPNILATSVLHLQGSAAMAETNSSVQKDCPSMSRITNILITAEYKFKYRYDMGFWFQKKTSECLKIKHSIYSKKHTIVSPPPPLRQGLSMNLRLAWNLPCRKNTLASNSWKSACLCLQRDGINRHEPLS